MASQLEAAFDLALEERVDPLLAIGGEWDALLRDSPANTVFLSAGWLRASVETYHQGWRLLIPTVRHEGRLIAAAAFVERDGVALLAGTGPADYLDLVFHNGLNEEDRQACASAIFDALRQAVPHLQTLILRNIPEDGATPGLLGKMSGLGYVTPLRWAPAPAMALTAAPEMLRKKSLRRHENKLASLGKLESQTFHRADEMLPRLEKFFEQHIARWADTASPSLFLGPVHREFFRRVTFWLDGTGWLRYTEIRLDDRLLAAHFGTMYGGRFTWYKPAFDPEFAKYSPGEVLIKRLIEQAQRDGAFEFDFTIGDEPFKRRFATHERRIVDLRVDLSAVRSSLVRFKLAARRLARRVVNSASRLRQGDRDPPARP